MGTELISSDVTWQEGENSYIQYRNTNSQHILYLDTNEGIWPCSLWRPYVHLFTKDGGQRKRMLGVRNGEMHLGITLYIVHYLVLTHTDMDIWSGIINSQSVSLASLSEGNI